MRLDKYLKISRLIKRRTIANEACDAGKISVNGKVSKASYEVKINDTIEIKIGKKNVKVKVIGFKEQKKDVSVLYEPIEQNQI
ncbi:MAG: RNA-binding S4 domain-containing protein [Clostridiales bacterium]|jgi:ribosomal 50S subunit-recycling heat shock protein|nr:RNA-binding S4 domain-containing protein [Clostridiales bacterium]